MIPSQDEIHNATKILDKGSVPSPYEFGGFFY